MKQFDDSGPVKSLQLRVISRVQPHCERPKQRIYRIDGNRDEGNGYKNNSNCIRSIGTAKCLFEKQLGLNYLICNQTNV